MAIYFQYIGCGLLFEFVRNVVCFIFLYFFRIRSDRYLEYVINSAAHASVDTHTNTITQSLNAHLSQNTPQILQFQCFYWTINQGALECDYGVVQIVL